MFMDLSEAFDTLNQDLLIAKLGTYGFQLDALFFLHCNLRGQCQRVLINSNFYAKEKIIFGIFKAQK